MPSLDLLVVHELLRVVSPVVGQRHHHDQVGLVVHHVPLGAGVQVVHSAGGMVLLAVAKLQYGEALCLDHEYPQGGVLQVLHHGRGSAVNGLLSVARDGSLVLPLLTLPANRMF